MLSWHRCTTFCKCSNTTTKKVNTAFACAGIAPEDLYNQIIGWYLAALRCSGTTEACHVPGRHPLPLQRHQTRPCNYLCTSPVHVQPCCTPAEGSCYTILAAGSFQPKHHIHTQLVPNATRRFSQMPQGPAHPSAHESIWCSGCNTGIGGIVLQQLLAQPPSKCLCCYAVFIMLPAGGCLKASAAAMPGDNWLHLQPARKS